MVLRGDSWECSGNLALFWDFVLGYTTWSATQLHHWKYCSAKNKIQSLFYNKVLNRFWNVLNTDLMLFKTTNGFQKALTTQYSPVTFVTESVTGSVIVYTGHNFFMHASVLRLLGTKICYQILLLLLALIISYY